MDRKLAIGERIKILRESKQLSGDAFGDLIGMTRQGVSAIEKGRNYPSLDSVFTIAEHFEVDVNWVLTGEGQAAIDNSNTFTMRDMKGGRGNTAGINNNATGSYVDEKCWSELEKTRERYYNLESKYHELVDRLLPKS